MPDATCDYCGLGFRTRDVALGPQFCCLGCQVASVVSGAKGSDSRGLDGEARRTVTRLGLGIFFAMNVMVFSLALWAGEGDAVGLAGQAGAEGGGTMAPAMWSLLRHGCLLFATPVLLLLGGPLASSAWSSLRSRALTTDLLLVLGVAAAFASSVVAVLRDSGPVYFDTACMVLLAVTLGRWLEAVGKARTTESIHSLTQLIPDRAQRLLGAWSPASEQAAPREDQCEAVSVESLRVGERVWVPGGATSPADGRVVAGHAHVDQQLVTGESEPVEIGPGDLLFAGATSLDGGLVLEVAAEHRDGSLRRLVEQVLAAARSKSRVQRLADRLAAGLVPLVTLVALGSVAAHWRSGPIEAILVGLAVTLIACPCALGIATPLAMWAALGSAARRQMVFRDGDALLALGGVRTMFFDKTGTLTTGRPRVARWVLDEESPVEISDAITVARALAAHSRHPASTAILSCTSAVATSAPMMVRPESVQVLPGRGVAALMMMDQGSGVTNPRATELGAQIAASTDSKGLGTVLSDGCEGAEEWAALGSRAWLESLGLVIPQRLAAEAERAIGEGRSIAYVGWEGRARAVVVLDEQLRDSAATVVRELRSLEITPEVLTGDHANRAAAVASALGVPARSACLPEDKRQAVESARGEGAVAMVGDGLNDAAALATADLGIAMGCGADASRLAADVCLLGNDLRRLPWGVQCSRRTARVVRQNLFWAFCYNLLGVGLAATGRLNPIVAALAMVVSSLLVVSNSLRLSDSPERIARGLGGEDVPGVEPATNPTAPPGQSVGVTEAA